MDIKVGSEIITTKLMFGFKVGTILKVKSIDLKEGTVNAEWEKGMGIALLFENRGKTWELKNDNIIKKYSSDLTNLDAKDLNQLQHAAVIINDRNWFEEIGKEIKKLKNELECLQDGYKQCGIEW